MGMFSTADAATDGLVKRLQFVLRDRRPYTWGQGVGLSRGTVGRLVEGQLPGSDKLLPMIRREGVSISWLISGQGTPYCVHCPLTDADAADLIRKFASEMRRTAASVIEGKSGRYVIALSQSVHEASEFPRCEVIGGPAVGELALSAIDPDTITRRQTLPPEAFQKLATGWMSMTELAETTWPKLYAVKEERPEGYGESIGVLSALEQRLVKAFRQTPESGRQMVLTMLESVAG